MEAYHALRNGSGVPIGSTVFAPCSLRMICAHAKLIGIAGSLVQFQSLSRPSLMLTHVALDQACSLKLQVHDLGEGVIDTTRSYDLL